jgi:hypothetical protein
MSNTTMPTTDTQTGINVDSHGALAYGTAAASGHIEIELPSLPGSPNGTERLHAKDFGPMVAGKIESAMSRNPYLKSGPQQGPAAVLEHYIATARGSGLMDQATLARWDKLAAEFRREPEQAEFFNRVVRPSLLGLEPKRRQP